MSAHWCGSAACVSAGGRATLPVVYPSAAAAEIRRALSINAPAEALVWLHCPGPFFRSAGQLTSTISGGEACWGTARTRNRWPSRVS